MAVLRPTSLLAAGFLAAGLFASAAEPGDGGIGSVGSPVPILGKAGQPLESAVLFVNDRAVTRSRVDLMVAAYRQSGLRMPEEVCRQRALQAIVFSELLRAEAEAVRQMGMDVPERAVEERWRQMLKDAGGPAELARRQGLSVAALKDLARDQLLGEAFRHDLLIRVVKPTPAELREYYQSGSEALRRPEAVKTRAVVIRRFIYGEDGARTPREGAERRAREVLDQLAAGGDFAKLAAKYSEDAPSAANGGMLGDPRKGFRVERGAYEAEVEKALFGVEPSGPAVLVEGRANYYVLQVLKRLTAGVPPFEEVEDEVFARCYSDRIRKAEEKFFRESFAKVLVRDAAGRRIGVEDFLTGPAEPRKRSLFDRNEEPEEPKPSDRTDPSDRPEPGKP